MRRNCLAKRGRIDNEALIIIETSSSASPSGMLITQTGVGNEDDSTVIAEAKALFVKVDAKAKRSYTSLKGD